ncbi:hypothetical protein E4U52_005029 [Claviceps spartinae]|nr:hypothetical protein E4U52_005029 [Claviceps spartinae]
MSKRISRIDLGDRRASHGSTAARSGMETGSSALNFATFPISGTTITTCTSSTSSINRQRRQSLLAGVIRQLAPIRQSEVIDENTDNGHEGQLPLRRHRHQGETRLLDRVTEPRSRPSAKSRSQSTSQEHRGDNHVQSASKSRRSSGYRRCTSSDDAPTMSTTTRESFEASLPTIQREVSEVVRELSTDGIARLGAGGHVMHRHNLEQLYDRSRFMESLWQSAPPVATGGAQTKQRADASAIKASETRKKITYIFPDRDEGKSEESQTFWTMPVPRL